MATYDYKCNKCGHEMIDVVESIKNKPQTRCPSCKKHGLERVIFGGILGRVKEIRTIGQLADENSRINKNKIQEETAKKHEAEPPPAKPWYHLDSNVTNSVINKMTDAQKKKFIIEGKKI